MSAESSAREASILQNHHNPFFYNHILPGIKINKLCRYFLNQGKGVRLFGYIAVKACIG